jgi:hypothetical protein
MDEFIRRHIEGLASAQDAETRRLLARLAHGCWPAGVEDRTHPAALGWVRRWHPARIGATIAHCSCTLGRCTVCN